LDAGSTPTYQVREGKEIDRSQIRRFGRGAARADSRRVLDPHIEELVAHVPSYRGSLGMLTEAKIRDAYDAVRRLRRP
jgi:hypothetical protein